LQHRQVARRRRTSHATPPACLSTKGANAVPGPTGTGGSSWWSGRLMLAAGTFCFNVLLFLLVLASGYPIAGAAYRRLTGFHPSGWEWIVPYAIYLVPT